HTAPATTSATGGTRGPVPADGVFGVRERGRVGTLVTTRSCQHRTASTSYHSLPYCVRETYMLSWERLRIFAALAKHGSVTAAADALHLTRPAVSQQLRKLEREARCQLVEPDGRGIRLTAAGEIVAQSATSLANTVSDTERDLAALGGQAGGPFRIGSVAARCGRCCRGCCGRWRRPTPD